MSSVRVAESRCRATRLVAIAAAAITMAGCSSMVGGSAARDPEFHTGDALPALLDPGNYRTAPHAPFGTAGKDGAYYDGQRMADFVIGPWEVDPTLTKGGLDAGVLSTSPDSVGLVSGDVGAPAIVAKHDFLVGFTASRGAPAAGGPLTALATGVLRFTAPRDATGAATDLGTPHGPPFDGAATPVPYPVPGHPDTAATIFVSAKGTASVSSFTPHGDYVLFVAAVAATADPAAAGQAIAKALDLQIPRIDEFTPTDIAKLPELPIDPSGLMARNLPVPKGGGAFIGDWGPRAALQFEDDPVFSTKAFADARVTGMAHGGTQVLEAKDPASAQQLLNALRARPSTDKPVDAIPGLPSARCSTSGDPNPLKFSFFCDYAVDRYVVSAASEQQADVRQQAAAQYLVLTAK